MDEPGFDWDDGNVEHNARHKVTPEEVEQALLHEEVEQALLHDDVEIDYQIIDGEERFVAKRCI